MPLDESPDDRDTGQIGLGEDPAHRAIIEKLAKDSRRSSLVALVGGIVIVASFVGIYVSVLDYRKSNTSLQTNLDTTSEAAAGSAFSALSIALAAGAAAPGSLLCRFFTVSAITDFTACTCCVAACAFCRS